MATGCRSTAAWYSLLAALLSHHAVAIFRQLEYEFDEEQPVGTLVGNIPTDLTRGDSQLHHYHRHNITSNQLQFKLQTDNEHFSVDELTGDVICIRVVDREQLCPPYSSSSGCDRQVLDVNVRPLAAVPLSSGEYQQVRFVKVTIRVADINDHGPAFPQDWVVVDLIETTAVGTTFSIPEAEDVDSELLSVQRYQMQSFDSNDELEESSRTFELVTNKQVDGSHEVRVRLLRPLDLETRHFYSLLIVAADGGTPARSGSVQVQVFVRDANDNSPTFSRAAYEINVDENVPSGTSVTSVHASDADSEKNGIVRYSLATTTGNDDRHHGDDDKHGGRRRENDDANIFAVNETTGEVFVVGPVDFELQRVHELTVVATDLGDDPIPAFAKLIINVNDVNDNPPRIVINALSQHHQPHHHHRHQQQQQPSGHLLPQQKQQVPHSATDSADEGYTVVAENAPRGTFVCHVAVSDPDTGYNSRIQCAVLIGGRNTRLFHLQPLVYDQSSISSSPSASAEYKLVTATVLDREMFSVHHVTVECHDSGQPSLSASQTIKVVVDDENDNTPELPLDVYFIAVVENNQLGVVVTTINATDHDDGLNGKLTFSLEPLDILWSAASGTTSASGLVIDEDTGMITADTRFDYETKQTFTYLLTVSDRGETVQRSAVATVVLDVVDANDELPRFDRGFYSLHVAENRPARTAVGRVRAVDADRSAEHNRIFYFLDDGGRVSSAFRINSMTGELFTRLALDRESTPVWKFRVRATNDPVLGPKSTFSVADVHVYVDDVNDNSPIFVEPPSVNRTYYVRNATTPAGHLVVRVKATDADEGPNGRLSYRLLPLVHGGAGNITKGLFAVDETNGDVRVARNINGQRDAGLYAVSIAASDTGSPMRLTTVAHLLVCINVTRIDDVASDSSRFPDVRNIRNFDGSTEELFPSGYDATDMLVGSGLVVVVGVVGGLVALLFAAVISVMICGRHQRLQRSNGSSGDEPNKLADCALAAPANVALVRVMVSNSSVSSQDRNRHSSSSTVDTTCNGTQRGTKRTVMLCLRRQSTSNDDRLEPGSSTADSTGNGSVQHQSDIGYGRHWYHADTVPLATTATSVNNDPRSPAHAPSLLASGSTNQACRVYPRPDAGWRNPRPMFTHTRPRHVTAVSANNGDTETGTSNSSSLSPARSGVTYSRASVDRPVMI